MPVPTFKESLMNALHSSVRYFNEGGDPNTAVIKAAQDFDFNTDQTTRLVETFNTARTIYHYKSASDRTVPFSIADSSVVIPAIFDTKKAAVKPAVVNHDYAAYGIPEADYREGMVIKSAVGVNDVDIPAPREYLDTNLNSQGIRAMEIIRTQRKLAEAARDESRVHATKAASILTKMAAELTRGYEEVVQERFGRLWAGYSLFPSKEAKDQWAPVMSKLSEFMPKELIKKANATPEEAVFDDRDLMPYLKDLQDVKELMEVESEMLAVSSVLDKEASDFEREWMEAIAPVLPKVTKKEATFLTDFIDARLLKAADETVSTERDSRSWLTGEPLKVKTQKTTGKPSESTVGKAMTEAVTEPVSGMVGTGIDSALRSVVMAPSKKQNVQLSERLKNVQRQLMLEDLMTNDPVLSEESPETVSQAYSAVMNMAPELSVNKEVVRAILRQAVHSVAISPFEAETWTKLEQNIRNIAGKTDIRGRPAGVEGERK